MKLRSFLKGNAVQYIIIISLCLLSVLSTIIQPIGNLYTSRYIIYYKTDADKIITDYVSGEKAKKINILNKSFKYSNKEIKVTDIMTLNGASHEYEMKVKPSNEFSAEDLQILQQQYIKYMKDSDSEIKAIHFVENNEHSVSNKMISNFIIKAITSLIYIFSYLFLVRSLISSEITKKYVPILDNKAFAGVFILMSILFMVVNIMIPAAVLFISTAIVIRFCNLYKDKTSFLLSTFSLALVFRLVAMILMVVLNNYKYGTTLSYFQPDEIFYYKTVDKIAYELANFRWPNLSYIVGINQYGYNLFAGIIALLNGEYFYTLKAINAIVSSLLVIYVYDFTMRLTSNRSASAMAAIFLCIMPTLVVFTTFALRDTFICVLILLIIREVMLCTSVKESYLIKIAKLLVNSVCLWYLRSYALIVVVMISFFYIMLRLCDRYRIKKIYFILVSMVGLVIVLQLISKLYTFSILSMLINYIKGQGIIGYITGMLLSVLNLDFILNMGGTTYTSLKSMIMRMLYPETLFLILSFPFFVIGAVKASKKNSSAILSFIVMFIGFITIYKMEYGGWFLRTQLQIFPYQYMIIAIGLIEVFPSILQKLKSFIPLLNKF